MKTKDKVKIVIIIFISLIITTSVVFSVYKSLINIEGNPNDIVYKTTSKKNIDYQLYLKDNIYIDEKILNKNNSYITALINLVKVNFEYEYDFDRNVDIIYNYLIKAKIISNYSGDTSVSNPLIKKEYILKEQTEDLKSDKKISIKENIQLNIDDYNLFIKKFLNEFSIPSINNLEISLVVNITGNIDNFTVGKEHIVSLNIPLGVSVFDITTSNNFPDEETIYYNPVIKKEVRYAKIIIYIVINLLTIFLSIYLIKKIIDKYQSKYILNKNKLLKDYDDRIVEVRNFIKYEKWETIDVASFEELLNLSNEAFEPIIFWERKYGYNKEAWFCILREKILYRFIIYKNENIKNQTQ